MHSSRQIRQPMLRQAEQLTQFAEREIEGDVEE
jgi:hypothetical protein